MKNTIGDKACTYEIGGKTYIQRPLVLGQVRQLLDVLQGAVIPGNVDALGLVSVLGDKLPLALAAVLTEEGQSPRGKDIPALAGELEFAISPEQAIAVIEDFFAGNPLVSFLERLAGMAEKISAMMPMPPTGSSNFASSSAMEISPGKAALSGE